MSFTRPTETAANMSRTKRRGLSGRVAGLILGLAVSIIAAFSATSASADAGGHKVWAGA